MSEASTEAAPQRRHFFTSTVAMAGGLLAGYGTLVVIAGRYLYSEGRGVVGWMFVALVDEVAPGDSIEFRSPVGERIVIARQRETGTAEDFIALSSTCPHLGCQVHWEPHNDRFFCPCHNGVFDPQGNPVSGPPAAAGQSLPEYPLQVQDGMLFIEVPLKSVVPEGEQMA